MIIKTPDNFYHKTDMIFSSQEIELRPGLTILVGCNGSGKSTFLKMIAASCKENDIPLFIYDQKSQGGAIAQQRYLDTDMRRFMLSSMISEGEGIFNDFSAYVEQIGAFVKKNKSTTKPIVITIDAIDSSLSINSIREFNDLFRLIASDCAKNNIEAYIVVAANSYELTRYNDCLYPAEGRYMTFAAYDNYSDFIMMTSTKLDARYKQLSANNQLR